MSRNQRLGLLALALVVAGVALVVARPGGSKKNGGKGASAPPPATIVVRGGKPVGGVRKLTYTKGDPIDLTVRSDVADEVHFHTYDVKKDVARGGSVRFRFPATIEGRMEVELEEHKQRLAEVAVTP
ncbi:MAG: hypothetical protein M3296_05815 [Actinomycetota bacterium]|nr:hypothetical protein [Actinomycetota bacterium]